jgi:methyl-accepting chemotaxis protein
MRATIKNKLASTFVIIIALLVVVVGVAVSRMGALNGEVETIISGPVQRMKVAKTIEARVAYVVLQEKNLALSTDPAQGQQFESDMLKGRAEVKDLLAKGLSIASEKGRPVWISAGQKWVEYESVNDEIRRLVKSGQRKAASELSMTRSRALVQGLTEDGERLTAIADEALVDAQAKANDTHDTGRTILMAVLVLSLLISVCGAVWISRTVTHGLEQVSTVLRAVAKGDLETRAYVTSQDEIADLVADLDSMMASQAKSAALAEAIAGGDLTVKHVALSDKDKLGLALIAMVERLRTVISDVSGAANNVATGAQQMSSGAENLAQGASQQASSTEEASSSIEEMASNVKQTADNSAQTEKIARQSAKDAAASGLAVNRAVDAMQVIAAKISIVQEIARQTDLLALNAAVEAARAGEHGRGFAVVASEVRKLAERSREAASEISTLSSDTVKAASEAGDMLTRLVPDIRRTAELVAEISAACREQDIGAAQINTAIQQLDRVTQNNAGSSEEISATAEELASQAEELQGSIAFFRTGASQARQHPAPRSSRAAPSPVRPARKASLAHTGSVADQQERARGFALDLMQGGPDSLDDDFEAVA